MRLKSLIILFLSIVLLLKLIKNKFEMNCFRKKLCKGKRFNL